jgi:hypothetical protein
VWVAVAVFTIAVRVNNHVADQPLAGGRQAIFNQTQTEDRLRCQVLGVRMFKDDADMLTAKHRADHPDLAADYQVSEHRLDETPGEPVATAAANACIDCRSEIAAGLTRCQPCQNRFWDACRAADPDWATEDARRQADRHWAADQ